MPAFKPLNIFLWCGKALCLGPIADNGKHQHHSLQICLAKNQPLRIITAEGEGTYDAVMIAPDQIHQLVSADKEQILILLEPESEMARELKKRYLKSRPFFPMDRGVLQGLFPAWPHADKPQDPCAQAELFMQTFRSILLGEGQIKPSQSALDERVGRALVFLNHLPEKSVSVKAVAEQVCLSESRLIHIFKENVGIPIRRYILWLRLLEVVNTILAGDDLTRAAHQAGFSDSAHLSRTFRRMFGMTLTKIFKNSRFVQVFTCSDEYHGNKIHVGGYCHENEQNREIG